MAALPEMTRHPLKRQSCICKCRPQCSHYIEIEDIGRYCDNKVMDLAVLLVNQVKETNICKGSYSLHWTTKQEKVLIDWSKKGFKYGDQRIIGELLGKTRTAVKSKIKDMTAAGRITTSKKEE